MLIYIVNVLIYIVNTKKCVDLHSKYEGKSILIYANSIFEKNLGTEFAVRRPIVAASWLTGLLKKRWYAQLQLFIKIRQFEIYSSLEPKSSNSYYIASFADSRYGLRPFVY